jgi:hypothetical protein
MQGTITLGPDPESDAYLVLTVASADGNADSGHTTASTHIHRGDPLGTALWAWVAVLVEAVSIGLGGEA